MVLRRNRRISETRFRRPDEGQLIQGSKQLRDTKSRRTRALLEVHWVVKDAHTHIFFSSISEVYDTMAVLGIWACHNIGSSLYGALLHLYSERSNSAQSHASSISEEIHEAHPDDAGAHLPYPKEPLLRNG